MLSLVLAGGGSFVVLLVSRWGRAVLLVGVFSGVFGRGRAWHVIGVLGQRAVWCGFLFPFLVGPAGLFWLLVGGWGAWCGWVGCELYSGREHRRAAVPSGLLLGGLGARFLFLLGF